MGPDQAALDAAGVFGDLVGHLLGGFEQHGNVEQGFLSADAGADGEGGTSANGRADCFFKGFEHCVVGGIVLEIA
ncbi:hypothetical protein CF161_13148 [Pseudomonas sp. CF161]|nr:hypothetical protein CF161_13148 [Pseudomonas sp. CF161]